MRRLFIVILCCLLLTTAVSAASSVTDLQSNTVFSPNGTCRVSLSFTLQLEEGAEELSFPLPEDARDITVNGSNAKTFRKNNLRWAQLSGFLSGAGTASFQIQYTLPDAVTQQKNGTLLLKLDLLSGFAYPIDKMAFSITMPGPVTSRPAFSSTYHLETIETLMQCEIADNTIFGSFDQVLKDLETVTMTLEVTEELFPQPVVKKWSLSGEDIAMALFFLAAALYWLVFLRAAPPRRIRRAKEPEGLSAGEVGCCLTGLGVDFTMMVLSWAQMGYLLIQQDENGRILLHKRMEMGNERSDFECRYFKMLFGRRKIVDGTGFHYARLARKASKSVPHAKACYSRGGGNPNFFRALSAGIGLCGGIAMAAAFASDTAWRVVLSILLGILGYLSAWHIQSWGKQLHLRGHRGWLTVSVCCLVWILLSSLAGEWNVGLFVVLSQLLAGVAAAYGGRRSETGKAVLSELLGLRRHMLTAGAEEMQRALRMNPDYFYHLAPYAMALGVDRAFSKAFGSQKLHQCSYLITAMDGHMTAREWNQLLRETVAALDERQRRLPFDRLLGR